MNKQTADTLAKHRGVKNTALVDTLTAKQIRQQIGLELKEKLPYMVNISYRSDHVNDMIDEVCQMEAQSDG